MLNFSGLVEHFPYAGLFILLILGGIGLPFPEDATLILCGFLISHDMVKPALALFVVYSGLLAADFFLYLVGRKYGRMIVTHKKFRNIMSPEKLSALEDKFSKKGILVVLVGRHLFGLRAQIFLASGVMRMPALKFIAADAVSSIFTIALMVGAGYIGGNSLQIIKKDITRIEHAAIFLLIIAIAGYIFYRYFKARRDKTLV
ncbi:MAG: DedA protein [Nitrospirae bacterium]|nr:MAG: DedA protein [Nitrospirota bacterium]